jgi:hypothetical protein
MDDPARPPPGAFLLAQAPPLEGASPAASPAAAAGAVLADCKDKLEGFLSETQDIGVALGCGLGELRAELRGCAAPAALGAFLLTLESAYCAAGEGLPPGADNAGVAGLLGDDAALLPEIRYPPDQDAGGEPAAAAAAAAQPAAANGAVKAEDAAGAEPKAEPMDVDAPAPDAANAAAAAAPEEGAQAGLLRNASSAALTQPTDDEGGGGGAAAAGAAAAAALRPVDSVDDLDDSDAEHAYLREKRMRRPARLWRSARERAAWVKTAAAAARAPDPAAASAQLAYATYLFCDRAGPMLQRYIALAEETEKWEAAERARAKADAARAAARPGAAPAAAAGPVERPLMVRTGKAKTDGEARDATRACEGRPLQRAARVLRAPAPPPPRSRPFASL